MDEEVGDALEIAGVDPLGVRVEQVLDLARGVGHGGNPSEVVTARDLVLPPDR